jgi:hypothetical protein
MSGGTSTSYLRTFLRCSRALTFLLAGAALGACSLTYDPNRQQCSTHSDCLALGVTAGMCVDGLCQSSVQPTSDSAAGFTNDASSVSLVDVDSTPVRRDADTSDVLPSQNRDGSNEDTSPSAPSDAGTGAERSEADAASGADTGGACVGAGCPECSIDADCERRGAGSTCADGFCWSPAAQCKVDGDCPLLGPEYSEGRCLNSQCRPNPRWRCERPPAASVTETKKLTTLIRDSLSLNPLVGIHASVCQKLDLQCTARVAEATTGADGKLTFTVPATFSGYLKVEDSKYFPAMYMLPAALPADGVLQPFPLLSAGLIVDALALALGTGIDPRRGHLMLVSEDCMGAALPGVSFKSPQQDSRTVQFYVRDLLPSTSATQTAEVGNGGYLNFPAGTGVITLEQVATKLRLNTVSIVVRAGYISVAYIRPELR